MRSQVVTFVRPSRGSDWSRDELAQLYRIESGLAQARLVVDTDRGLTDEGDPWFVFCRGDGEVLVHITRVNGQYSLYSPIMPHPLVGKSFSTLAKSFVSQVPFYLSVPTNQGAQLFVHPASMLAVLIGTIFFIAQDMRLFSTPGASVAEVGGQEEGKAPSLPAPFHWYIDHFLASMRDWTANQKATYFTTMSTALAFVVGSVGDHDHREGCSDAELAGAGDAASWCAAVVAFVPDEIAQPNRSGEGTQAAADNQLSNEVTAPSGVAEEHGVVTPYFIAKATTQLVEDIAFETKAEDGNARSALTAVEAAWTIHRTMTEPGVETAEAGSFDRSDAIIKIASQAPQSSAGGETSTVLAPTAVEPMHGDAGFSTQAFGVFIHAIILDFPLVSLASSDQDLGHVIAANAEGLSSVIASAELLSSESDLTAFDPTPTSTHGDPVAAPLFDDAAAAVINAFLHANPDSEIIFDDDGNIIVYDGHRELDGVRELTIQAWESETGVTIAIVGHADHPLA